MNRPVFIINFKNYREVLGEGSLRLATSAANASKELGADIIVAPPAPALALVAASVKIPVFGQKAEEAEEGKSTGAVIPEALSGWGCAGSIINHSESRVSLHVIEKIVPRMRQLGLKSCVCAENPSEVAEIARIGPEQIAIEPKDLIGTGIAISKARPGLITDSLEAARRAGYKGSVLCGAGIVSGDDVAAAMRLGAEGILVASAVVKAKDWDSKILELGKALSSP